MGRAGRGALGTAELRRLTQPGSRDPPQQPRTVTLCRRSGRSGLFRAPGRKHRRVPIIPREEGEGGGTRRAASQGRRRCQGRHGPNANGGFRPPGALPPRRLRRGRRRGPSTPPGKPRKPRRGQSWGPRPGAHRRPPAEAIGVKSALQAPEPPLQLLRVDAEGALTAGDRRAA